MGPGHALQLPDGRIVVSGTYSAGPPQSNFTDYRSYAFYTSDHGASFQIGGDTGYPGSNESQVAQLCSFRQMLTEQETYKAQVNVWTKRDVAEHFGKEW